MNEHINLVEILKDVPEGTKLWSPLCGECTFVNINTNSVFSITVNCKDSHITFTKEGYYRIDGVECLLFPSKDNRDWATFKTSCKHKHFEPFEKVLIINKRAFEPVVWIASIYSHYKDGAHYTLSSIGLSDDEILPYEGNEDKLGKLVK